MNRNAEIGVTLGCAAAAVALILGVFEKSLVLLFIAEMKTLGYEIAQVLAMQPRVAF